MQIVGEDFGKMWLEKYSDNPDSSDERNDLWSWGVIPRGYQVERGQLYPVLASTEWYFPLFPTNSTPLYLNGTAINRNRNYISQDFISPDSIGDPWFLAQLLGRTVVIFYPSDNRASKLR
jgi:hypothetical protein